MKRETKTLAQFLYEGLGFPVYLKNCPMVKAYGEWVPAVNFPQLEDVMAIAVALKPARLTGAEVRFLRVHFDMTLQELADEFGLSRQAVAKWEKKGQKLTDMGLPTERDFRVFALIRLKLKPEDLVRARQMMRASLSKARTRHSLDARSIGNRRKAVLRQLQALSA